MLRTSTSKRVLNTQTLVTSSLITTISIILTRLLGVMVPLAGLPALRLDLGHIPIAITGILFGPLAGGLSGAIADLLGFMVNSYGGPYFPGFTISSILWGVIPGLIYLVIKKRKININYNIISTLIIVLLAIGVVSLFISNGVISVEDGSFSIQEGAEESFSFQYANKTVLISGVQNIILIVISAITFVAFLIAINVIPRRITKRHGHTSKNSIFTIDRIVFCVAIPYIIVNLGLNTLWLSIMFQKGFMIFLPGRILAGIFMIPIFSIAMYFILTKIYNQFNRSY